MSDVNQKMLMVMQGFAALNSEERLELLKWIKKYQDNFESRKELMESFAKTAGVSLGPTGQGSCPCCGR